MNSIRKWFYKPKKDDTSKLAQFYWADEELNLVATELDSFDGRKDPDRCSALVNQLRMCQDKVLNICHEIMDEAIPSVRAHRDFRAKFPDDVLQENLSGLLWFGAECLAAGSNIMNREVESASMRPLAKALTRSLDNVRCRLREQCLKNPHGYSENVKDSLIIFDRLFAEFELCYVSAMVPVKSAKEYHLQQEVIVLFSETLQRASKLGLVTQEMVDDYDPSLMFTIPRLAIVCGLLLYPDGPLNLDREPTDLSELFRPFYSLLCKIRDLLWTLSHEELWILEKTLCQQEEPKAIMESKHSIDAEDYKLLDAENYIHLFYKNNQNCKQFIKDFYWYNFGVTSEGEAIHHIRHNFQNRSIETTPQRLCKKLSIRDCQEDNRSVDMEVCKSSDNCDTNSEDTFTLSHNQASPPQFRKQKSEDTASTSSEVDNKTSIEFEESNNTVHKTESRIEGRGFTSNSVSTAIVTSLDQNLPGENSDNENASLNTTDILSTSFNITDLSFSEDSRGYDSDSCESDRSELVCPFLHKMLQNVPQNFPAWNSNTLTDVVHRPYSSSCPSLEHDMSVSHRVRIQRLKWLRPSSRRMAQNNVGDTEEVPASGPLSIPQIRRLKSEEGAAGGSLYSSCSSCRSVSSVSSSEWECSSYQSTETSSYNSECHDDEEIALALQAAEIAFRNEARSRFKNSEDLIHRLFVCISGVADQLQTNYASDMGNILKCVFDIHCSCSMKDEDNSSNPSDSHQNASEIENRAYSPESSHPYLDAIDMDDDDILESNQRFSTERRSVDSAEDVMADQLLMCGILEQSPYMDTEDAEDPPGWLPDDLTANCMDCEAPFTFLRRRHHCRKCGKIFCSRCSSNSIPLPRYGHLKPVRVCNPCFVCQVSSMVEQLR